MEGEIRERFVNFLKCFQDSQGRFKYRDALAQMASLGKTSLIIDFEDLMVFDSDLAKELKENPLKTLHYANLAIVDVLRIDNMEYLAKVKEFKARFRKLDEITPLRALKSSLIGSLIMIEGIITRTSAVKQLLEVAVFQCLGCEKEISIEQSSATIITPSQCDECGRKGRFKLLHEKSKFIDWQRIRVQERPEELPPGQLPRSIDCVLRGDLVDTIRPGDRVYVVGILRPKQDSSKTATFSIEIDVNNIEISEKGIEDIKITPEDEKAIIELSKDPLVYQKIFSSIAPSIYGYEEIKEAIAYQLAGGVPKIMPDGIKIRGDINILLVGDPGTGKSQLLQYVAKIAPRGIYTSGKGATAAGLTATVVRDKETNEFFLEAGALVLADNGIACLHPNTRIMVNNEYVRIEDLFNEKEAILASSKGEKIELNYSLNEVLSIDTLNLKTKRAISTIISRKFWNGKLIKLAFESGHEIILTEDHLLLDGSTLEWKHAKEFKPGDIIVSLRRLPDHNDDVYIIDILPEDYTVIINGKDRDELLDDISRLYEDLKILLNKICINHKELHLKAGFLRQLLKLVNKYDKWKEKTTIKCSHEEISVAKITPELGYLIGFILGNYNNLSNEKEIVSIKDFNGIIDRTLMKIENKNSKITISSSLLRHIVNYFLEDELRRVFRLSNNVLKAFLAGLIDSSGQINTNIEIMLSDFEKAKTISLVLRRFNILSKIICKGNLIKLRIIDKDKLIETIKAYSSSIILNEGIIKKETSAITCRGASIEHSTLNNEIHNNRKDLSNNLMLDYYMDRIIKVEYIDYKGFVYDLYVPGVHNFLAEGIIVHNCIDEIDKMRAEDRVAIHEAMEQQSYHPSFEIILANNTKYKIGTLVDSLFEKYPKRIMNGINCQILPIEDLGLEILTTDFSKIYKTKVNRVSRHKAPDYFIRICYSNDVDIIVTPEHPIFVFQNDKITTIEASKVRKGAIVPTINALKSNYSKTYIKDIEMVLNEGRYKTDYVYDVTVEPTHNFISHELLLHNTISIAKAGIVVQLNARTSILAAANPTFGRYVPQRSIAENLSELPVTILSRFDLIFPLMDRPQEAKDRAMTEHILALHQGTAIGRMPLISPEFLKKYFYYIRKNAKPRLSEKAAKKIEEFFLEMRGKSEGADSPVPITMRQLEALIRLSEARAKLALKEEVTDEDVEAAIKLMKSFLLQVGMDRTTGKLDIDTIMVGRPKSISDKLAALFDLLITMEKENGMNPVKRDAFIARAESEGFSRSFIENALIKWTNEGIIYEAKPGYIKKA